MNIDRCINGKTEEGAIKEKMACAAGKVTNQICAHTLQSAVDMVIKCKNLKVDEAILE